MLQFATNSLFKRRSGFKWGTVILLNAHGMRVWGELATGKFLLDMGVGVCNIYIRLGESVWEMDVSWRNVREFGEG